MAVQSGKGHNEQVHIQTSTFICTHVYSDAVMQLWRARMQLYSQQKQCKGATTVYLLCRHFTVLLKDTAPHLSYKETRKNPIKDKGVDWTTGVFMFMEL